MKSSIPRLKLFFLGLFAVLVGVIWAYHVFYIWPRDRCEAHAGWWDPEGRQCGTPVLLSTLTGKPNKPAQAAVQPPRVAPGAQSTSPAP